MCAKLRRCVSLHRFGAFLSALSLCFALCVPALADETLVDGMATLYGSSGYTSSSSWFLKDSSNISSGSSDLRSLGAYAANNVGRFGFKYLTIPGSVFSASGSYGIYLSFYYYCSSGAVQSKVPVSSDFCLTFLEPTTESYVTSSASSLSLFAPSSSASSLSDGVTVSVRLMQSESKPISTSTPLYFSNGASYLSGSFAPAFYFSSTDSSGFPFSDGDPFARMAVTSFRIVSTASNAELDALESMAAEIANQSQILSQFYGDIVQVCNQIYQRLGDIQAAQEEANSLFSNVISLLNITNSKIEAINMAMSTYFELLINQLKQEGIDTRTAIADAEARLEAYLKPMIDYFNELQEQTGESAATLPGHKTDIDGFNNQGFGIDFDGQTGVAALVPILSAFSWIWSIIALFIGVGLIHILVKKGIG